jgi:hypothetical protein
MVALIILLAGLLLFPGLAQAGPPLLTSDTGTPGDGHWEINLGFSLERSQGNSQSAIRGPDINYGLGEKIQLKLETAWLFDNPDGGEARNGAGNSALGIKWRFLEEEQLGIAMSVYPQLEFNSASYSVDLGLVDPGAKFILPVQAEKGFGPFNVHGELGYIFSQEGGNQWLYGLACGYRTSKHFQWVGELYGVADSNLNWDTHNLVVNLGFRWNLIPWLNWNTGVGRSLHTAGGNEKTFLFYTGVQFVF